MNEDSFNFKEALPLLQSFGISPEQLGPDKLEKICALTSHLSDPSKITPELSRQIMDTLGINLNKKQQPIKRGKKIGRNEKCPCESGKKYKICCGKM
jgi:uncharacterized protein YecA (UPF0149 family)